MVEKEKIAVVLEKEVFTPALQKAVKAAAKKKATVPDILTAAGNAYINLVVVLMGGPASAAGIIQAQAEYLKTVDNDDKK